MKKEQYEKFKELSKEYIIEEGKRKFVKWDCKPAFMLQDGGRTLKIFIDGEKIKSVLDEELKR